AGLGSCTTWEVTLQEFDKLWDYDDPVGTELKFRSLLPEAEAAGDTALIAELLTQIARTQGLQRDFEGAAATLEQAKPLLESVGPRARVRWLLEHGRVLNSSGKPAEARPDFVEAWNLALAASEEGYAADAAHMIAIVETPEGQIEWNERALEL